MMALASFIKSKGFELFDMQDTLETNNFKEFQHLN